MSILSVPPPQLAEVGTDLLCPLPASTDLEFIFTHSFLQAENFEIDDWTGIADVQARKRIQNRLRKRLASTKVQQAKDSSSNTNPCSSSSALTTGSTKPFIPTTAESDFYFPIPADHLLTLIEFNIRRATHLNLSLLAPYAAKPVCDLPPLCQSLLNERLPPALPPSLTPTDTQRQIKHPAWIDAIPLPQLRDNFILALGTFEYNDLCIALLRGGDDGGEHKGVMVWGDPWEVRGWEMTEGFSRKWGFILRGCEEFVVASNQWRRKRGEKDLVANFANLKITENTIGT